VQYHRSDLGKRMLLAFRSKEALFVFADLGPCAIDPNATCGVAEADTCLTRRVSGRELTERNAACAELPLDKLI